MPASSGEDLAHPSDLLPCKLRRVLALKNARFCTPDHISPDNPFPYNPKYRNFPLQKLGHYRTNPTK
ncbi:hypothetical protein EYY80_27820 [Klebsiella oxytoca]|nr:hypothetical protein [Klebsiella oxytoca]MBZ7481567.1 hypothetical protein [Klebsiella oxytoca]MBZ7573031.1 hypothetical protein [Klebsiella oxytoca]MBZ7729041.1 hypothetical protein [Klebsiella oxytoca]RRZ78739.1 hypothetical protein EGK39_04415 [Klebsiella oxytoca]